MNREKLLKKYDILIIGGGIIGTIINFELSKYNLQIIQVEKNSYLADETTSGNSGVIHGGFDAEPNKIEALLNVRGNKLWVKEIFPRVNFPRAKIDSLIIAFNKEEQKHLDLLYKRGITNGVLKKDLKIIDQIELRKREPQINSRAKSALLCTSSWVIDPVLATRAFAQMATENKSRILTNTEVTTIAKIGNQYKITLNSKESILAKTIINAAGHYADQIAAMAGHPEYKLTTRRGEYRVLSKTEAPKVKNICFKVPTIHGKGVIVSPMLSGRVLIGPTAVDGVPKQDTRLITQEMFAAIGAIGKELIPSLNIDRTEIRISGSRPIDIKTNDFIIRHAEKDNNFIHVAGMQSPGISSAPAIAKMVLDLVKSNGTKLIKKAKPINKYNLIW